MRKLAAACCLLALSGLLSPSATGARRQLIGVEPCVPSSEFSLAGIRLYQSESAVRRALGRPRRVTLKSDEDDGGVLTVRVLHYPRLEVEIARGKVDSLYTDSPGVSTRSGIETGMKFGDVRRVLGKESKVSDEGRADYNSCDEGVAGTFTLEFDGGRVLRSIDIRADRP